MMMDSISSEARGWVVEVLSHDDDGTPTRRIFIAAIVDDREATAAVKGLCRGGKNRLVTATTMLTEPKVKSLGLSAGEVREQS
jgi:hypothetical protein